MTQNRESLLTKYRTVRSASIAMCQPLEPEEFQVQTSEEVSPPKWNLGHTSWFYWQFIPQPAGLTLPADETFRHYLNSYYHKAGTPLLRGWRGLVTRPTLKEIYAYRASIDERVERLISTVADKDLEQLAFLITTGCNHEQQHQELFYTEIKNIYFATSINFREALVLADHNSYHLGELVVLRRLLNIWME